MDVKKTSEQVDKLTKKVQDDRKCLDCATKRLTDADSRSLETIVIDLVREFEETSNNKVSNEFYEVVQAHVHDAYDIGNSTVSDSIL